MNEHEIPGGKVRLLDGTLVDVAWDSHTRQGEIAYPEPEYLDPTHQHTRTDAEQKASRLAPHITQWTHT
jgi:hypothetical protein